MFVNPIEVFGFASITSLIIGVGEIVVAFRNFGFKVGFMKVEVLRALKFEGHI